MKKVLVLFAAVLLFASCEAGLGQTKPVKKSRKDTVSNVITSGEQTGESVVIKGAYYQVYQGSRGGKFIIKTNKYGKQYKSYLPK